MSFVLGVFTNRLGSLLVDPSLRFFGFLYEKNYDAFVSSEKNDPKLPTLVANHGLYRSFFTAGFVFLTLLQIRYVAPGIFQQKLPLAVMLTVIGMAIFLLAFKKEDKYIHDRIAAAQKKPRGGTK